LVNLRKVIKDRRNQKILTVLLVIGISAILIAPTFPMKAVLAKKSKLDKVPRIQPYLGNTLSSASDEGSTTAGSSLTQIPSEKTDFPSDDSSPVEVNVISAKKDIIGSYHVRGEIRNVGNDTLQFVKVTAHFYDADNQPVGATSCCYADPSNIEAGHTSTFDSFAMKDTLSTAPSSYRLSFDWQ
jgi:hypothetical protein